VCDPTSGFRAYRACALRRLDFSTISGRGFVFQVEILFKLIAQGASVAEVPIQFRDRKLGRSKLSYRIIAEALVRIALLRAQGRIKEARSTSARVAHVPGPLPVSVVIPAPPGRSIRALDFFSTRSSGPPLEVIVARGFSPSLQRNKAAALSKGEILLFLDDDSLPAPGLLRRYEAVLSAEKRVAAVGGPACLEARALQSKLCSALLCERLVVGRSASRYRPYGALRRADERDLILCNLAVRRSAFLSAGGFDPALYPNEENDLLFRLGRSGWHLLYDPEARISRPAWPSVGSFLLAVGRYGRGRGTLARKQSSPATALRMFGALGASASALLAAFGLISGFTLLWAFPLALYAAYALLVSVKVALRLKSLSGLLSCFILPCLHAAYAGGLLFGLLCPRISGKGPVVIERYEGLQ